MEVEVRGRCGISSPAVLSDVFPSSEKARQGALAMCSAVAKSRRRRMPTIGAWTLSNVSGKRSRDCFKNNSSRKRMHCASGNKKKRKLRLLRSRGGGDVSSKKKWKKRGFSVRKRRLLLLLLRIESGAWPKSGNGRKRNSAVSAKLKKSRLPKSVAVSKRRRSVASKRRFQR